VVLCCSPPSQRRQHSSSSPYTKTTHVRRAEGIQPHNSWDKIRSDDDEPSSFGRTTAGRDGNSLGARPRAEDDAGEVPAPAARIPPVGAPGSRYPQEQASRGNGGECGYTGWRKKSRVVVAATAAGWPGAGPSGSHGSRVIEAGARGVSTRYACGRRGRAGARLCMHRAASYGDGDGRSIDLSAGPPARGRSCRSLRVAVAPPHHAARRGRARGLTWPCRTRNRRGGDGSGGQRRVGFFLHFFTSILQKYMVRKNI
jgi:hypothetical protein